MNHNTQLDLLDGARNHLSATIAASNVTAAPARPVIPTGFAALDTLLNGGWPAAGVTEMLVPREGIGALQLLLPTLADLSQQRRWIAWVAPPYVPYAPALAAAGIDPAHVLRVYPKPGQDGIATLESCLRSGRCAAVLAWPMTGDATVLRRLQRAALAGGTLGVLFRPHNALRPAASSTRLRIERDSEGISVQRLDAQGGSLSAPVQFGFDALLRTEERGWLS